MDSAKPPPASATGASGWARDALAAFAVSLVAVSFYTSSATLLFQGPLQPHLPAAIGAGLLGGALLSMVAAWRGSLTFASAGPEPGLVPVIAAITVAAGSAAPPAAALATAVVSMMVSGIAIGAAWWLMGRRGWGDLIRYVPYPVIGGFLASVGYLLLTGGFGVAMAQPYTLQQGYAWLTGHADLRLVVALGVGIGIWWVTAHVSHPLTLPALLLGVALTIHGALAAAGLDIAAARAAGWLPASFGETLPAQPFAPALLAQVRWDVVAQQAGLVLSAVIVATLSLLLSDSSLEVAWDEPADFNRDLRVLGIGNLVLAAIGGLVGGISISRSLLSRMAGAVSRRSSVIKGALCLAAMGWGGPLIALVPRPLLGGLLVYLGIGMLKTWLIDSRQRLPLQELLTIVAMLGMTALAGFLPAVGLGALACCVDFAINSSRLSPVRRLITRRAWPSKVERSPAQDEFLQQQGDRLLVIELQDVLFFGSVTQLSKRVDAIVADAARPERIVFDFQHVRWLDTSAGQALARLFRDARRRGVRIELSQLSDALRRTLRGAGVTQGEPLRVHADIDAAIGAWDDEALAQAAIGDMPFEAALARALPSSTPASLLLPYFERVSLAAGEVLFRQGDASDALFFVRSGRLAVALPAGDHEVTVRTVSAGSTVGEMGLLRMAPRSATARAEQPSELLRLGSTQLLRLEQEQPALAAALYRVLLLQMAGRLDQLTMQANALARPIA